MKNKKNIFLILLIVAALAGAAFYFLYFIRTPLYAINTARTSFKEHDLQKFERYVDITSVMDNAFEDIIKAESKINNDNIFANPFALGILHMLKPSVVNLLVQETRDKISAKQETTKQAVDPVPDAMKRNMERRVPTEKMTITDLKISKIEDEIAIANVALHIDDLDKNFIAEVQIQIDEKGDWQIKKVANLADLIVQIDAAKKAKLAAANKPILEQLNKAVKITQAEFNILKETEASGVKNFLATKFTIKNMNNSAIKRMYYDVIILDENKQKIYSYPAHFQGNLMAKENITLDNRKKLSSLLPDDKKLIEKNTSTNTCEMQVTYIVFEDGKVLSPNTVIE